MTDDVLDGMDVRAARPRGMSEAVQPSKVSVVLYSHDTFGLGHLRRNLAIAAEMLRRPDRFAVTLLTGSPVIGIWRLPAGLRVQPLPPVVKVGVESYAPRDGVGHFGMVKGYREALILKQVLNLRPDVLLVDHAPAGMNGELLSTLSLIRREMPGTRTILGLRDILDSPEAVRSIWESQGTHALIDEAYDDVFVYGSRSLFDIAGAYGLSHGVAKRVRYCGHVVERDFDGDGESRGVCWSVERAAGRPVALVTVGGGGDGRFLVQAYLESLCRGHGAGAYSVIVLGPLMDRAEKASLIALAEGRSDVEFVDVVVGLQGCVRAADLVVSMAGYNTCAEIVANRKKAVLVPRAAPRAEQRMRARLLADMGLAVCVEPSAEDLPGQLGVAVDAALAAPPAPEALWRNLPIDGAAHVAEQVLAVVEGAHGRTM